MQDSSFDQHFARIQAMDPRFHRDAYVFVRDALDLTQKALHKENRRRGKHVSGQELLGGIREHALQLFGPMAKTVLEEWGVTRCEDFGDIVFNLIAVDWFAKTSKDSRADFAGGYSFDEAFLKPFLPASKQTNEIPEAKHQPSAEAKP
jgi:uncharacterized repeat protein (TIGR04138 family)